ncbi:LytR/AlgR family response regulator transcription factor [Zhouia sp. PK063]|uniref:LytR/AlgR family response regulator transcription factor n=1 Tax=Zhouia sp. PK063 TaxID=3373602 RepID=UPI0037A87680
MQKFKAIIVEDEATSREILQNYIQKYCPNITVVAHAANIEEALIEIKKESPDILFLDVEMPYGNAFDLLEKVGERTFETIFVTAYNHYAMDALNQHAAYYLMKPISIDELIKAVDYVTALLQKERLLADGVLSSTIKEIEGKITIPQQDGFEILNVSDILYCKADDNYTEIYVGNKKLLASKTLKYFETALEKYPFARIHKSYLVNVNYIVKYKKGKGGSVILENGKELMVSSSKKSDLLAYFN